MKLLVKSINIHIVIKPLISVFLILLMISCITRSEYFRFYQSLGLLPSNEELEKLWDPGVPLVDSVAESVIPIPFANILAFKNDSVVAISDRDEFERLFPRSSKWDSTHDHEYYLLLDNDNGYKKIDNFQTDKVFGIISYNHYLLKSSFDTVFRGYKYKVYIFEENLGPYKVIIQYFDTHINIMRDFYYLLFINGKKERLKYYANKGIEDYIIDGVNLYFLSSFSGPRYVYKVNVEKLFTGIK